MTVKITFIGSYLQINDFQSLVKCHFWLAEQGGHLTVMRVYSIYFVEIAEFIDRNLKPGKIEKTPESESPGDISRVLYYLYCRLKRID